MTAVSAPVRLSRDELVALRTVLGLPAGALRRLPWAERPPEAGHVDEALRSLLDRGVVTPLPDGGMEIETATAEALRLALEAGLVIRLDENRAGSGRPTLWFSSPDWTAEWHAEAAGRYALATFPTAGLLVRVAARANLVGQAPTASPEVRVSLELAGRAGARIESGDLDAARSELAPGLSPTAARTLVQVLGSWRSSYRLTARHLDSTGRFAGASTSWVDAGDAGLWLTDESDPDQLALAPVAASHVLTEIVQGLPGAGPP